jgi:hypothetical protein
MPQKQAPERSGSGEESLRENDRSVERFKALTKRLLTVNREELAEQEAKSKNADDSKN